MIFSAVVSAATNVIVFVPVAARLITSVSPAEVVIVAPVTVSIFNARVLSVVALTISTSLTWLERFAVAMAEPVKVVTPALSKDTVVKVLLKVDASVITLVGAAKLPVTEADANAVFSVAVTLISSTAALTRTSAAAMVSCAASAAIAATSAAVAAVVAAAAAVIIGVYTTKVAACAAKAFTAAVPVVLSYVVENAASIAVFSA